LGKAQKRQKKTLSLRQRLFAWKLKCNDQGEGGTLVVARLILPEPLNRARGKTLILSRLIKGKTLSAKILFEALRQVKAQKEAGSESCSLS